MFYIPSYRKIKIGLMLSYKHWWHDAEPIYDDNAIIAGHGNYLAVSEIRSTYMNGLGAGIEFSLRLKSEEQNECLFFWNASFTEFKSQSYVYSLDIQNSYFLQPWNYSKTYPYDETKNRFYFNITVGFKFGFKNALRFKSPIN